MRFTVVISIILVIIATLGGLFLAEDLSIKVTISPIGYLYYFTQPPYLIFNVSIVNGLLPFGGTINICSFQFYKVVNTTTFHISSYSKYHTIVWIKYPKFVYSYITTLIKARGTGMYSWSYNSVPITVSYGPIPTFSVISSPSNPAVSPILQQLGIMNKSSLITLIVSLQINNYTYYATHNYRMAVYVKTPELTQVFSSSVSNMKSNSVLFLPNSSVVIVSLIGSNTFNSTYYISFV
ncbi:hypothetical protein HS7_19510 [Sulfolobales archaeon HS-7]|nr:hypothetical protein HS7_19510 [Sulfolobales archaeon HS-7]